MKQVIWLRHTVTVALAAQLLGCAPPVFFLKVKDPATVQVEQTGQSGVGGDFREAAHEFRMQCHDSDDDLVRRSVAWAAFDVTKANPDRKIVLECPAVPAKDHRVRASLSTPAPNVGGIEREVRWGLAVGTWAATLAGIPAGICAIGALAAPPDQQKGAWTCAGISAAFVVAGLGLALLNPTTRAAVAPVPRPVQFDVQRGIQHGVCQCSYQPGTTPPSSCSDSRCGAIEWD